MCTLDFNKPINVHFIGIGGISMSGLAQILMSRNFTISGSDIKESYLTGLLKEKGARIYIGHKSENINKNLNLVVYTAAIVEENEELKRAKELNIPIMTRARLLGLIMGNYKNAIAVSGTHGKTTTTSMIAAALLNDSSKDATITVGGMLNNIEGNLRIGGGQTFLTEACEYMNSFLEFKPSISLILNVEEDHLDFFKDIYDIRNSFNKFAKITEKDGVVIINNMIDDYEALLYNVNKRIVTFGDEKADYHADNIRLDDFARASFDLYIYGENKRRVNLGVSGLHNVYNFLAATAACVEAGMDLELVITSIEGFSGTHRRFEYKGEKNGVTIIDDYAHHPTEIRAALDTAKGYRHKELWVVFQPHTYTRTKALFDEFVEALKGFDHVILTDIYAAREKNTVGIHSKFLSDALKESFVDSYYFDSFEKIEDFVQKKCKKNDMLITMGAGNVVEIADDLLRV